MLQRSTSPKEHYINFGSAGLGTITFTASWYLLLSNDSYLLFVSIYTTDAESFSVVESPLGISTIAYKPSSIGIGLKNDRVANGIRPTGLGVTIFMKSFGPSGSNP
jgi:hypothetical protein